MALRYNLFLVSLYSRKHKPHKRRGLLYAYFTLAQHPEQCLVHMRGSLGWLGKDTGAGERCEQNHEGGKSRRCWGGRASVEAHLAGEGALP